MQGKFVDIPNEEDWRSEPLGWESQDAYVHFFGLSMEQAAALYANDPLARGEEIMWMPARCFRYYILACTHCILSASRCDTVAAGYFLSNVETRMGDILSCSDEVFEQVIHTLEKLSRQQDWCDVPDNINDDAAALLELVRAERGKFKEG